MYKRNPEDERAWQECCEIIRRCAQPAEEHEKAVLLRQECDETIAMCHDASEEMGRALLVIQERKLWSPDYDTWTHYLTACPDFKGCRALKYRYMKHAKEKARMSTVVDTTGLKPRHTMALALVEPVEDRGRVLKRIQAAELSVNEATVERFHRQMVEERKEQSREQVGRVEAAADTEDDTEVIDADYERQERETLARIAEKAAKKQDYIGRFFINGRLIIKNGPKIPFDDLTPEQRRAVAEMLDSIGEMTSTLRQQLQASACS